MSDETENNIERTDSLELDATQTTTESTVVVPEVRLSFIERLRHKLLTLNIYVLIFVLLVVVASASTVLLWQYNKRQAAKEKPLTLETLSQTALDQLRNKDSNVGDAKQTLTIASNSVFNGRVLVRDSLDVAGTINVGGSLSLPGITVAGTCNFDEVQVGSNLTVGGSTTLSGSLNLQSSLNVNGGGNFGGPLSAPLINVESLAINGNLTFTRHIDAGGGIPNATSTGSLGAGGTANVNGSDTAGTITINTGSGASSGIAANITFASSYNQTPHITIAPVGAATGSTDYYITRTTSGFSVGFSSQPPSNTTLTFDYVIIE